VPDWSYHPLLKPLTAWLPTATRRNLALSGLHAVTVLPAGFLLVELLGRMRPDASLTTRPYGRPLLSPIGLGAGADPDARAIGALGRFGFGFLEVGPYPIGFAESRSMVPSTLTMGREPHRLAGRLRSRPSGLSIWLRVSLVLGDAGAILDAERLLESVQGAIDVVAISLLDPEPGASGRDDIAATWRRLVSLCHHRHIETVLVDWPVLSPVWMIKPALEAGAAGVVIRGPAGMTETQLRIREVRQAVPAPGLVVVACGLRSPRDIVQAVNAGADLVAVDEGLIEAGPGLAKRGNEALLAMQRPAVLGPSSGWLWLVLLGLGMILAGAVVFWVGMTRVLLPYDETFLGVGRNNLGSINPRLLGFMRHDRLTLAGTLMSIGILYASLAWNGVRSGQGWARDAILASGVLGFASLFLFLGFHYVDPVHIILSASLFPLFVLGIARPGRPRPPLRADLDNDSAWRRGLLGQLLFIGLAAGLIGAGFTITTVGVTRVFVFSDLQFLQTTAIAIGAANAHLLPLIAHDRAGFGGALASDGVALLLLSLWGFRRGERWVWWTLLGAGLIGLSGGVYAHLAVGYLEFGHLLPVALSAIVFIAALWLTAPFLLTRRASGL
jgi:dihydroorotate dehydrogenase